MVQFFYESHSYKNLGLYQNNHSYFIMHEFQSYEICITCFTKCVRIHKRIIQFWGYYYSGIESLRETHISLRSFPLFVILNNTGSLFESPLTLSQDYNLTGIPIFLLSKCHPPLKFCEIWDYSSSGKTEGQAI